MRDSVVSVLEDWDESKPYSFRNMVSPIKTFHLLVSNCLQGDYRPYRYIITYTNPLSYAANIGVSWQMTCMGTDKWMHRAITESPLGVKYIFIQNTRQIRDS